LFDKTGENGEIEVPETETDLIGRDQIYELVYELNEICPTVMHDIIPLLEVKLRSSIVGDRLASVALLARMFSEKESTLAAHHTKLWRAFLER
jgi:sister-chromatid-cohesion protein PDS5